MTVRFKHKVEYHALRLVCALVCRLPYRAALALGAGLAWFAFYVLRFRVAEAERRIRFVLGGSVGRAEVRRIAWISLRNLFFNIVEIARFPRMNAEWVARHSDVSSVEAFKRDRWDRSNGTILAVPHMGNWDLAGIAASLLGLPMFFMARRQKNPLVDELLNEMRNVTGVETILTDSRALRKVVRNLKQGKVLAILPDVRARETGILVPFLGGEAALATGMEAFARHSRVPIYPACALREGWTRHRWIILDPVYSDPSLDRDADRARIMCEVMAVLEKLIRQHPEQYFWYNKRWILDPLPSRKTSDAGRNALS